MKQNQHANAHFLVGFWSQENKAYRNMQIVFSLLSLHFLIPAISYFFTPDLALNQFQQIGQLLGGGHYPVSEDSIIWRVLASGNVFTLGWMCLLLQLNIKRFHNIVPVFAVLKGWSSLGYLYVYLFQLRYPAFLAVTIWDAINVFLVIHYGRKVYRSLADDKAKNMILVPPLVMKDY
jgi:hypothetical protein